MSTSDSFIKIFLFFKRRRRHTRFDCDWSSDVCSSDLFTTYDVSSGLGGNYIYSIFRDSRQRLWIGTSQKGLTVLSQSRFSTFSGQNGFADVKVKATTESNDGWLYFGTDGQGVYAYDGASFELIPRLEQIYVRGMVTDKDGVIWIATAGSGLIKLVPNGTLRPEITFITVRDR